MKTKTYDPSASILAARVALADQESVDDPELLRAAGAALFHASRVGSEPEILRGMLAAAEDAGAENLTRMLRRALGQGKDLRSEEIDLLWRLKDTLLREGVDATVAVLDDANARLGAS